VFFVCYKLFFSGDFFSKGGLVYVISFLSSDRKTPFKGRIHIFVPLDVDAQISGLSDAFGHILLHIFFGLKHDC